MKDFCLNGLRDDPLLRIHFYHGLNPSWKYGLILVFTRTILGCLTLVKEWKWKLLFDLVVISILAIPISASISASISAATQVVTSISASIAIPASMSTSISVAIPILLPLVVHRTPVVRLAQLFPAPSTRSHTQAAQNVPQTGYDYTGAWGSAVIQ